MLRALLGLVLPVVVGFPFTLRLTSLPTRLAMSYLTGVVVITVALAGVGLAASPFTPLSIVVAAAAWLVAAALAVRRSRDFVGSIFQRPAGLGWAAWALLGLAAFNVATAAAYAVNTPITIHDVVVIWLPKVHALGPYGFLVLGRSLFPDYPPLWPLHLFLADGGGQWWKVLPTAYLICALAIAFDFVRARVGPVMAAATVFVISGIPYIWLPYGVNDLTPEIPMLAFVTASTLMLADYVDQPSIDRLAAAVAAGIGAILLRPEGFVHGLILATVLVAAGILKRRLRETLIAAGALALTYVAWQAIVRIAFNAHGTYHFDTASLGPANVVRSLAEIFLYSATYLGNPYVLGPALILAISLVLGCRHWRSYALVGSVFLMDFASIVVIYVLLPTTDIGQPLIWWLSTGFKRLLVHFMPLLYISTALAFGSLLRYGLNAARSNENGPRRFGWANAMAPLAIVVGLTSIGIAIAGYAAYRVGGPKSYDLSDMVAAHITGTTIDYSTPGMISLPTTEGGTPRVTYYLQVTGRRLPPLDNMSGTFGRFSSFVEVLGPSSVPERLTVSVDGQTIAEITATPESGTVALTGQMPPGGRFLELSVQQLGPGTATVSWEHPTVYRASLWWATEALLIVALVLVLAFGLVASGAAKLSDPKRFAWLTPAAVSIPLLAAAAVQQAEAIVEVALPTWAYAFELVMRHL